MTDIEYLEAIIANGENTCEYSVSLLKAKCSDCPIHNMNCEEGFKHKLSLAKEKLKELTGKKFNVGDKVRCKRHGTVFIIDGTQQHNGEILYYEDNYSTCNQCNNHSINNNPTGGYSGIPEYGLELVSKSTEPQAQGENKMGNSINSVVTEVFKDFKTGEAEVVQKHFGNSFEGMNKLQIFLIKKDKKNLDEVLKEAQRLEAEEKKRKE